MRINLSVEDENVEKIKYPDGQVSVVLKGLQTVPLNTPMWVSSRFNSYEDLAYILAATDSLRSMKYKNISLYVSCFLGQRSDRRFGEGQSFDLKILTNIINHQKYKNVTILHPHSDVLPALLDNVIVQDNSVLVDYAVQDIASIRPRELVFVSPDAGAYKAIFKHASRLKKEVVTGNKYRDKDGNLNLQVHGDVSGKDCLIIDDYCDGGRTFTELAKKLNALGAHGIYLCVTHGLFSAGFNDLDVHLDGIYTTNSIQDIIYPLINQYKVI